MSGPTPVKKEEQRNIEQEDFFIKVDNPLGYRRNLLEASKSTLGILRELYSVKAIREKKVEVMMALQKEIKELKILVQKLDEMMPQYSKSEVLKRFPDLRVSVKKHKKEDEKKAEEKKPEQAQKPEEKKAVKPIQKKLSDLERLNQAMETLDKKMSTLPKKPEHKNEKNDKKEKNEKKDWTKDEDKPQPKPTTVNDINAALDSLQKKLKNI